MGRAKAGQWMASAMAHRKWLEYPRPGALLPGGGSSSNAEDCQQLAARLAALVPDGTGILAGIDVGGAVLASAAAMLAGTGFITMRKIETLGPDIIRTLTTNYHVGDGVALARGFVITGRSVVLVDDLLVSGHTAAASAHLLRRLGAEVRHAVFMTEIEGMGAAATLAASGLTHASLQVLPQPADPRRFDEALAHTAPYRHA
jgi:adenine/guanine phosphoribosyltransferase-like PRPP-binding protein